MNENKTAMEGGEEDQWGEKYGDCITPLGRSHQGGGEGVWQK